MTDSFRPTHPRSARQPLLGLAALSMALGMSSCVDDDDPSSQVRTPTFATFSPSTGSIPIPNDLLFSGSTDFTLNPPIVDVNNTSDPLIALSTVDGWSTTAPILVNFSRALDPATVVGGGSVHVYEVTAETVSAPVGGAVTSIDNELVAGVDYAIELSADFGGQAIAIQPLVPLAPSTVGGGNNVYMVVVTDAVTDTDGFPVARDAEYIFAAEENLLNPPQSLADLAALVDSHLDAFVLNGGTRDEVVVSFTFTTQSVGASLSTVFGIANGQENNIITSLCAALGTCGADVADDPNSAVQLRTVAAAPLVGTASELLGGPTGIAQVYAGILQAPYYLTQAANTGSFSGLTNDPAPLVSKWQARYAPVAGVPDRNLTRVNPLPISTSSQQMPVLISVPDSMSVPMPGSGYPVVIFQHGIGGNRSAMLFVAETLAAQGLACIAIDLPLHGVADGELLGDGSTSLFLGYNQAGDVWERTFGMDLLTETMQGTAAGPDGVADSSGASFINLTDVAVSRDNIRQGIADLFNLKAGLSSLLIMGADVIDESQVHFMGHSLGGIVGTGFVALQTDVTAATLAMPGASIPYLLNGSLAFGPAIRAGLAASDVNEGTPEFAQFLAAAQTVVDTADPINYAALIQANATPIYLPEIIGGGANMSPSDLVIPNTVTGAPFAGTEPLISALGLTATSTSAFDAGGLQVAVRFIEGNHSSILFPTTPGATPTAEETAAFTEMQSQAASFHALMGTTLTVTDGTVIQ